MGVLIVLSLLSHILVSILGGRISKTVFCVISGIMLVLCLLEAISFMAKIDFYPTLRLYALRDKLYVTIPAFVLTVLSAGELSCMIRALVVKVEVKRAEFVETKLISEEYPLPGNERKAGTALHRHFKIVRNDK